MFIERGSRPKPEPKKEEVPPKTHEEVAEQAGVGISNVGLRVPNVVPPETKKKESLFSRLFKKRDKGVKL